MQIKYDIWPLYSGKTPRNTTMVIYCEKYTVEDVLQQRFGFTPRSTVTCLRLLTFSAGDEYTTGYQQNLRLSIRVFMTRGVPLS